MQFWILDKMETPNKLKRKRQTISFDEKKAIIEASKTKNVPAVSKHFNNKYPESTIKTILKNKDSILKAIDDGIGGKRAILKSLNHPELKEAILKLLKGMRSENIPVDGPFLKVC